MSTRRQVLKSAGVILGTASLPIAATLQRHRAPLPYEIGTPGLPIENAPSPPMTVDSGDPTLNQIEGPFYTPKTPRRRDLRDELTVNPPIVLTGHVLDMRGNALPGAVLDFWHTADDGGYDNNGFRYRGHQFTDSHGRYRLTTILPQAYSALGIWRTAHIHVKVQGPGTRILTTQLYRPDTPDQNARDWMYRESLLMRESRNEGAVRYMRFDFVVEDA